ncbi:hypothetical protein L7F22_056462 [Adiantum nelumboides]|nr:hypothetical protein [Adiantum nelumboides]
MEERRVHPDCINSSNPYHECSDYCFRRISEAQMAAAVASAETAPALEAEEDSEKGIDGKERDSSNMDDDQQPKEEVVEPALDSESYAKMTPMQKKLFDLRLKLNAARKANQSEIVAEKKRAETPVESRGISKQKWFAEKQKRLGKHLELNGLETSKAFMLDTQEAAETKYKKWEKRPAPFGWDGIPGDCYEGCFRSQAVHAGKLERSLRLNLLSLSFSDTVSTDALLARSRIASGSRLLVFQRWTPQFDLDEFDRQQQISRFLVTLSFSGLPIFMQRCIPCVAARWGIVIPVFNQRSLYNAYKKRTKNIPYSMEEYMKAKESDPDFFRDGSSLQYGKAPDIPEENVEKMVAELEDRDRKRKSFSRRRKFHDEKDIDSINDRNEHFNRKIERAFGKYTVEIKNNLERGTALPD